MLDECKLVVNSDSRILLEGSSGCGKSTLASIISGLRKPDSGLLLLNGLDLPSVGTQNWRKQIVLAPQFHENHIFMGTFAFNLLMGKEWPPSVQSMKEAREVCHFLGLDPLLAKMPGGMSNW